MVAVEDAEAVAVVDSVSVEEELAVMEVVAAVEAIRMTTMEGTAVAGETETSTGIVAELVEAEAVASDGMIGRHRTGAGTDSSLGRMALVARGATAGEDGTVVAGTSIGEAHEATIVTIVTGITGDVMVEPAAVDVAEAVTDRNSNHDQRLVSILELHQGSSSLTDWFPFSIRRRRGASQAESEAAHGGCTD